MNGGPAPGDTVIDAVIVGAGLAGLTAARRLDAAGASVMVIEAQNRALGPLAYAETDWGAEIYSRGGYAGVPVPGMLLDYGPALAEPVGRIHWAGAETAPEWTGYMDGAVESGERVAREVLSDLSGDDLPRGMFTQGYTHRG
jgi:monoamine oxidase